MDVEAYAEALIAACQQSQGVLLMQAAYIISIQGDFLCSQGTFAGPSTAVTEDIRVIP